MCTGRYIELFIERILLYHCFTTTVARLHYIVSFHRQHILLEQPTKVGTYSLYMLIYVVFQFTQKKSRELSIRLSRGKPICLMFEMPIFFLSGSKFHLHGMLSITWTSLQRTVYFIVFSSFINLNVIGISQIIW